MGCSGFPRKLRLALVVIGVTCGLMLSCNTQPITPQKSHPQYDLLITGGHIVDGTESPWYQGSVAVKDGKIAAVGPLVNATARKVIDAAGLVVAPGMAADITIFNPQTVIDKATFKNPLQYPEGIPYVIVNRVVVTDKGNHTGAKPGQVLYGRGKR